MLSSLERIAEAHLGNEMRHNDDRVLAPIALERWESDGEQARAHSGGLTRPTDTQSLARTILFVAPTRRLRCVQVESDAHHADREADERRTECGKRSVVADAVGRDRTACTDEGRDGVELAT